MGEVEFQQETRDRLMRMETMLQQLFIEHPVCQKEVRENTTAIAVVDEKAKSAHRRIDGILVGVGLVSTIVSTVVGIVVNVLKVGGSK